MLKVLVAFFIVLNVAVALWVFSQPEAVVSDSAASQVPIVQADNLILLSEIDTAELNLVQAEVGEADLEEQQAQGFEPEPLEPVIEQCVLAGPFESTQELNELIERTSVLGINSEILVEIVETPGSYMVYIEPYISAQEAQRELRVLLSLGVDSFVIADGELDNGISLGVFSTRQNAMTQQVRLDRLGYQTQLRQFMIEEDLFSLNFSGDVLSALEEDYWTNISNEYKDISIEQKPCNEVASAGKFQ